MSKYNSPADFELLNQIKVLQDRLSALERSSQQPSFSVASPINADEWISGDYFYVVNSASFTTCYYFPYAYLAPTPVVVFEAVCSDTTTSGEARLSANSTDPITGPDGAVVPNLPIPLGTTSTQFLTTANLSPNYWTDFPIGTRIFTRLQVRRTAGAGTITIRAHYLYQKAS